MDDKLKRISYLAINFAYLATTSYVFLFSLCLFITAWNMQWTTGYILLPSTDDWMDAGILSAYLNHESIAHFLFQKIGGHPQILIKLVALLHYKFGFTDYHQTIAFTVLLQLVPFVMYTYVIWKHTSLDKIAKLVLLPIPLLFFYDYSWSGMFRIIESHIWSWAYVFSYIAIFLLFTAENFKNKITSTVTASFFALIASQFFAAAFGAWLALFYFVYVSRWQKINYVPIIIGLIISSAIFISLPEAQLQHMVSLKLSYLLKHFLYFIDYFILLCGNCFHFFTSESLKGSILCFTYGLFVVSVSSMYIYKSIKTIKNTNDSLPNAERFLIASLIFSLFIVMIIAFGRFQVMIEHPEDLTNRYFFIPIYVLPSYGLSVPFLTLLIYKTHKKWNQQLSLLLVISYMLYFSYSMPNFNNIFHNKRITYPDSFVPLYEYSSLAVASGVESESLGEAKYPFSGPVSTRSHEVKQILAGHVGFAKWPGMTYFNKIIGKDIPLAKGANQCRGAINEMTWLNDLQPRTLMLNGWAWNATSDKIPSWVFIANEENKIIGVASPYMSQPLWQTQKYARWVAFVPNKLKKPVNNISLWVMLDGHEACLIQSYNGVGP